jgi:hypothetical protein
MATKKTDKKVVTKKAAAPKKKAPVAKKEKTEAALKGEAKPRHPKARVVAAHHSKEALAKTLAESLARPDEDTGVIAGRLKTASNSQLLRLQSAVELMKSKYGSRDKLVAAVAGTQSKDKDYTAKLDKLSLPNLLELAKSAAKRAANV